MATKEDLRARQADTDSKFDLLRKDMDVLRKDIIIKLGSMVIGTGVVLIAAMGALATVLNR